MPWDILFIVLAAILMFVDGLRLAPGKYALTSLAWGFIFLSVLVWRY